MKTVRLPLAAGLLIVALAGTHLFAGNRDLATVDSSIEVLRDLSNIPMRCIPPALMQDARAVAVIPHVMKAGLVVDRRFGRGLIVVRQPNGGWSDPIFVDLEGGGIGLEAGVESTDVVLIFHTIGALDHMLKGKLTLGTDVAVAAGPVGRDVEADRERWGRAEIFSYSRSRGLFAGVSLAGSRMTIDEKANEQFYGLRGCRPEDILGRRMVAVPAVEALKGELERMSPHR